MNKTIQNVVIVGGGTAGWITACLLAARHQTNTVNGLSITLIESPDVPTVGVGEGTWPTMRKTLKRIGIDEKEFLKRCDVSFKQGSRFDRWVNGNDDDQYLHPFTAPTNNQSDWYTYWKDSETDIAIADALSSQAQVCKHDLAPKDLSSPDYAGVLNYAYHLDAVSMATMLKEHATNQLGVQFVSDHVIEVINAETNQQGDIKAVTTKHNGDIQGDLFIDCTGHRSILLGQHFGIDFVDRSDVLINDRAVTTRVPYSESNSVIRSQTISTAHRAGWIWDIGLGKRRGIGCVYSSQYMQDEEALDTLKRYISDTDSAIDTNELETRCLKFPTGYRKKFWQRNCLAVGLSAGFLEPLEASAIVLIELSAEMLAENFPVNRKVMDVHAKRFNELFVYRWERIIDFLKLHYVLSKRTEPYWQKMREPSSIPKRLQDLLLLWKHQSPSISDFSQVDEVFPAASYLYVLYGMGFETQLSSSLKPIANNQISNQYKKIQQQTKSLLSVLPTNRALINSLTQ